MTQVIITIKTELPLHVINNNRWCSFCWSRLGGKNFIKGEYGAVEIQNGEILQFYDIKKEKEFLLMICCSSISRKVTHDDNVGIWYQSESQLPEITLSEVMEGFKTNSVITVRVEELNDKGQK